MEIYNPPTLGLTEEELISSLFLGNNSGLEIVNVNYNGDPIAVGYFTNASNDIGIESGIIMSTGNVLQAPGGGCLASGPGPCPPSETGDTETISTNTSGGSDPDLATIAGQTINDAAIYSIDFIPYSDSIAFRYVFASEEYQGFTCSNFNDAFGFFLSGPGISGGFSNGAENIALVPGTNLPVAIGTINSGTPSGGSAAGCQSLAFSQFFVQNIGNMNINVEYNGFTTVLTATAAVVPCQQYTMRMAIGDASDSILDSAVFLEAGSFGVTSLQAEAETESLDGTISEGCPSAVLSFTLPNPAEADVPVNFTLGGDAIEGVDYSNIPDNVVIPMGQDSVGFVIDAFEDGIDEGLEEIYVILQLGVCSQDTTIIRISDNLLESASVPDTTICSGGTATLDATTPTVVPPPIDFTNNTVATCFYLPTLDAYEFPIEVSGLPYEQLEPGVLNSICINLSSFVIADVTVFLSTPGGQILELTTQNGAGPNSLVPGGGYINTCFTEQAITPINFNPDPTLNYAPDSSIPFTGDWLPEGNWSSIYGGPVNGTWTLLVTDLQNGFSPEHQNWTVSFNNTYSVNYEWSDPATLSAPFDAITDATPATTTTYTVTISDSYGCETTESVTVNVIDNIDPPVLSCGASTSTSATVTWTDVPAAAGYQVSVDNGPFMDVPAGDLSYTVTGLANNQTVTFEVISLSAECNASVPATIDCSAQDCALVTSLDNTTDASCVGTADGTATLSATGSGVITYDIGGGNTNTTGQFTGLATGDYTVTITDADCSLTESFTINTPNPLVVSLSSFSDVSCNGAADGSIAITVQGGATPYDNYQWGSSSTAVSGTDNVTNLIGGTYTVTVTDANGCTATLSQIINENSSLTATASATDASCNGAADGTIAVTASGGSSTTYTYLWDAVVSDPTTSTITSVDVGTYTVTVTDTDGCTVTASATVTAPVSMATSMTSTPASCSGATDGTATISVSGGTPNYSYLWDNNQTTATATGLSDGWHVVTVTDANSCIIIDSVEVTVPNPIILTTNGTDPTCNGVADGTVEVMASGGVGSFSYQWSTGNNTATTTAVPVGTYTVTVTDANNCSSTAEVILTEPDALAATATLTPVDCNGESTGAISWTTTGGTAPYSYQWSAGLTGNETVGSIPAGDYTTTITDANGCSIILTETITENPALAIGVSSTDATCNGVANGTATALPSGGTAPYTYQWDAAANNQTTDTATNLDVGTYTVTVTDDLGCTITGTTTVSAPDAIQLNLSSTALTCHDAADGTATVVATGGTLPFTYSWSNGDATPSASNLTAGWAVVTVEDANGCMVVDSVEVIAPDAISLTTTGTDVSCNGDASGQAIVVANGGDGNYTYDWGVGQGNALANLNAGTYTVTVTDGNGCAATAEQIITEPLAMTLDLQGVDIACNGGNTGSVTTTVSGGVAPYFYTWNVASTANNLSNLSIGTYAVTVTDANNCTIIDSITLTEPPAMTTSISLGGASCNGAVDGEATVMVNGGVAPYTYLWSDGQTNATATNLSAQIYTVTVTDANNCTVTDNVNINEPPLLEVVTSSTNLSCFANNDGTVSAVASGGSGGSYTYDWGVGTGATVTGLTAGSYTVTVTDGNNCTATAMASVIEPVGMDIQAILVADVSCSGGADGMINLFVEGGTAPYSYDWSNNTNNEDLMNVSPGSYTVTVTDAGGCTLSSSFDIGEPDILNISLSQTATSCFQGNDGRVDAVIAGGITPYTYAWSNGSTDSDIDNLAPGEYTLTVTDANGCTASASSTVLQPSSAVTLIMSEDEIVCNGAATATATVSAVGGVGGYGYEWSNGAFGSTISGLGVGTYTVTVTDTNGCSATEEVSVAEYTAVQVLASSTPTSCYNGNDGTATVTNVGGGAGSVLADYELVWSTNPPQMGATATNLTANETYTVTVIDAAGCTASTSVTIDHPTELTTNLVDSLMPNCSGAADGFLAVEASGGTPPYTYEWDNGQTDSLATALGLGSHSVTITDANGCTVAATYSLTDPTALDFEVMSTDLSCYESNDGSISVTPSGGTPPYEIVWSNADSLMMIDSLAVGDYSFTLTDANGCTLNGAATLTEPDSLSFGAETTAVSCYGDRDGTISFINVVGGTAPYQYSFDGGNTFVDYTISNGLLPGTYPLMLMDANGCQTEVDTFEVTEPEQVVVNILPDTVEIHYELGDSVQLVADVQNAVGTVDYSWDAWYGTSFMDCLTCPNPMITGYESNNFSVVVTDENGCQATDEVAVIVDRTREVFVPSGFTPNNDGANDYLMVHGQTGTRVQTFRVYDRWGELVFRADDYNINEEGLEYVWNGTFKGQAMNPGIYIWYVSVRYIDGREESFEGNTTLIR